MMERQTCCQRQKGREERCRENALVRPMCSFVRKSIDILKSICYTIDIISDAKHIKSRKEKKYEEIFNRHCKRHFA